MRKITHTNNIDYKKSHISFTLICSTNLNWSIRSGSNTSTQVRTSPDDSPEFSGFHSSHTRRQMVIQLYRDKISNPLCPAHSIKGNNVQILTSWIEIMNLLWPVAYSNAFIQLSSYRMDRIVRVLNFVNKSSLLSIRTTVLESRI